MSLKTLLKKKDAVKSEMKGVLSLIEKEDRVMTKEETAAFESKKAELEALNSQIALVNDSDLESDEPEQKTKIKTGGARSSDDGIPGPRGKAEFENLEEFMQAALSNPDDSRLEYVRYKSQDMKTGAAGGFAVPAQFRPALYSVNAAEAIVRPRANVIPAGSPPDAEISIPALDDQPEGGAHKTFGGVTISKVAEGGSKPTTGFDLRLVTLKPHEFAAMIPFTDKLLRNWQAASGWATNLLRGAITAFEDYQFFLGNGVGGPAGIIDSAATYEVARTTSMQIAFADLKEMLVRFSGDLSKALWVCSYSAFRELLDMTGDGGGATNIIAVDKSTGSVSIYGIPVRRHPRVRSLGAKGDIGLYDFSEYLIKDGSGPIVETGYATGQWERNSQSVKITMNVDGKTWRTAPFLNEEDFEVSSSVVLGLPSGS